MRVQDPRVQNEGSWNSYVDYKIFLHVSGGGGRGVSCQGSVVPCVRLASGIQPHLVVLSGDGGSHKGGTLRGSFCAGFMWV